ncbi:MAG TPA: sensory rhodopsin transducer [Terriglobia bacterium]|nr:sensory rhodopsin transducer [Terriglobia bacterium]
MAKKSLGAKVWLVADSYLPDQSTGGMQSHESVCVLNLNRRPAKVKITVYFEDREPLKGLEAECPGQRTVHVRMERIKSRSGEMIPVAKPMALMVESNVEVIVQHTRLDTTQPALALMTTMAFPLK